MKLSKMATLGLGLLMIVAMIGPASAKSWGRDSRGCRPVHHGWNNNISASERARLMRNQQAINRYKQAAWSDGRISRHEYRRLDNLQDWQRREISQARNHNSGWRW